MKTLEQISAGRIIAILRGDFGGRETEMVQILMEGGITAVEVTLNSPGALNTIRRLAEQFGTRMAVGAGTVLQKSEVGQVADAGGTFIVSPNRDLQVVAEAKRRGLVSLPGCFTPSEVIEALDAGADAAKLFPAQCLGAAFVRAMRGPLPHARLIPTGGVTPEAAREYIPAGAWAVGVGSELFTRELIAAGDFAKLRARVEEYIAALPPRP